MNSSSDETVVNIQVLRCFAALAVVWRHMFMWFGTDPGYGLLHVGRAGVDLFFVISGFIMFHTTRNGGRSTLQFWTDRAIRIAPLYWLMTLFIVVLFLVGLPAGDVKRLDANDIPLGLAFFPNLRGDMDWNPILATGWTLIFEMYFYFLFGLTFFLRSQARALALLTVLFIVCYEISIRIHLPFALFRWFQPITLEFAAGGLLALLYRWRGNLPVLITRIAASVLITYGIVAFFVVAYIFTDATADPTDFRTLLNGPPAVAVVAGALMFEKTGVRWNSRALLLLGATSYSIYLAHLPVLQYASLAWRELAPAMPGLTPVFYALTWLAAVAAGVGLHFAFERPVHGFLKSRIGARARVTRTAVATPAE